MTKDTCAHCGAPLGKLRVGKTPEAMVYCSLVCSGAFGPELMPKPETQDIEEQQELFA